MAHRPPLADPGRTHSLFPRRPSHHLYHQPSSQIYPYPDLPAAQSHRHTQSAPPPPPPSSYSHPRAHQHQHHDAARTCIPSLIPPGMDPAQVDMRTFFPYTPNEVKHRRRTTRAQLRVLEDVYKRDTKPNAALRRKLAGELDMTPRGVQVWFQNRRAKTKMQAKKAASVRSSTVRKASGSPSMSPLLPSPTLSSLDAAEAAYPLNADAPEEDDEEEEEESMEDEHVHAKEGSGASSSSGNSTVTTTLSRRGPTIQCDPPTPQPETEASSPDVFNSSPRSPPHVKISRSGSTPEAAFRREVAVDFTSPFGPSSSSSSTVLASFQIPPHASHSFNHAQSHTHLGAPAHDPFALRRGSLPNLPIPSHTSSSTPYYPHVYGQRNTYGAPGSVSAYDPGTRHASISIAPEPFLQQLGTHPFAGQAYVANGTFDGSSPEQRRPSLAQHAPAAAVGDQYELGAPEAVSPSTVPPLNIASRAYGLAVHLQGQYVSSSRTMGAPIPGPLPAPGFSFGAPAASSSPVSSTPYDANAGTGYDAPAGYDGTHRGSICSEPETDSDYEAVSRFGSIASIGGGSESSWTSYYESDEGGLKERADSVHPVTDERRGSGTAGQFVELFSGLDVGNGLQPRSESHPYLHQHSQSSPSLLLQSSAGDDGQHSRTPVPPENTDMEAYSSPAPTGGHHNGASSPSSIRRSCSSELAYALNDDRCGSHEGVDRAAQQALPSGFEYADPPPVESGSSSDGAGQYAYHQPPHEIKTGYAGGYDVAAYPDGYTYAYMGMSQEPNPIYEGGAVELSHKCVSAEFVSFGGYGLEYS